MAAAQKKVLASPSAKPSSKAKPPPAAAGGGVQESAFAHLLKIEFDARRAASVRELDALFTTELRKLLRSRQVFVVEYDAKGGRVVAMTGVPIIDRSTPMVAWLERMLKRMSKETSLDKTVDFELPGYAAPDDALTTDYPFRHLLWQPMWSPHPSLKFGAIFMREKPWVEADHKISGRLGETFGHARTLLCASRLRSRFAIKRKYVLGALLVTGLLGFVPVPISVLAPVEVVPRDAEVVAMPIEGIVQKVLVQPNTKVEKGTPLIKLLDTVERNKAAVASRQVAIARARVEQANILALSDPRGRQELGLARAELALKVAEENYAQDLLSRTLIKAERAGVTVFSDPREIEGKPLGTGDRLLLIARENEAEFKISLPVADSIVLRRGLRVKAFLDSDPLNAVDAEISRVDHQVRVDERQIASYRVTAKIKADTEAITFGSRGTAQILGERAPLFIYLLRRPLTALRQTVGL